MPSRFFSALVALGLVACGESGQLPLRQVQFCLTPQFDAGFFKAIMQNVADKEDLRYHDRSESAEAELRRLEALEDSFPLILISGGNGEYGFGASNGGLPPDQIAVGFRSPETAEARAFAGRTVENLKMYWDIVEVPDDRGALPIKCA